MKGIYFLANDRALDNTIALLNSIRDVDDHTPVAMIPAGGDCARVAEIARDCFGAIILDDSPLLAWVDGRLRHHFGDAAHSLGRRRQWACWFGPFEEFVYLDCGAIVLERIAAVLEYLQVVDFVCCDDRPALRGRAPANDGSEPVGSGEYGATGDALFASYTGLFSRAGLDECFAAAAARRPLLDLSSDAGATLLDFAIRRSTAKCLNVYRDLPGEAATWAGSPHLVSRGAEIVDRRSGRIPRFVHWTGVPIGPGGAHWEVWKHYRELRPELPSARLQPVPQPGRLSRLRGHAHSLRQRARAVARDLLSSP